MTPGLTHSAGGADHLEGLIPHARWGVNSSRLFSVKTKQDIGGSTTNLYVKAKRVLILNRRTVRMEEEVSTPRSSS